MDDEEIFKLYQDLIHAFLELKNLKGFHTDFRGLFVGFNKASNRYILIDNLNNMLDYESQ